MKETFLVKHAVGGRTFIDTGKTPVDYEVEPQGEGWRFTVNTPLDANVQEILNWKEELNVFIFQEFESQPTRKNWFYVNEGPVEYDEAQQRLTIVARSKIEYVPDEF
jgi:hypothetical protein